MTDVATQVVRREIGKLLGADYPDGAFCVFCLEKLVRDIFGSSLPKAKAERTVDEVFESPGAITPLPRFWLFAMRQDDAMSDRAVCNTNGSRAKFSEGMT